MCRWLAYSGTPVMLEELLVKPTHSLIDQSLHSRLGVETTNGDGFGVGWYGEEDTPAVFKSIEPAWNDRNLRELAHSVRSGLVFAHIRASTGTPIQQTNCHPFRHGRRLWMHNGLIREFPRVRRELTLAVDDSLFTSIEGTTDSELMFHLALTYGLEDDPLAGLERMAGLVEDVGHRAGIEHPLQMTVAVSDGERVWAARYASGPVVNSLFATADASAVRELHPEDERVRAFSDEARAIVSEPLGDLPGLWREIPPGTAFVIQPGEDLQVPFAPRRDG